MEFVCLRAGFINFSLGGTPFLCSTPDGYLPPSPSRLASISSFRVLYASESFFPILRADSSVIRCVCKHISWSLALLSRGFIYRGRKKGGWILNLLLSTLNYWSNLYISEFEGTKDSSLNLIVRLEVSDFESSRVMGRFFVKRLRRDEAKGSLNSHEQCSQCHLFMEARTFAEIQRGFLGQTRRTPLKYLYHY